MTSTASLFGLPDDAWVLVEHELLEGSACRVVERADDGQWYFLDRPRRPGSRHLRPTLLDDLAREDPGLVLVADLAPGWMAWRTARGSEWARIPARDAYHEVPRDDSDLVFAVGLHEVGFLEWLWLRLTWRWRRREILRRWFSTAGDSWEPPGPDHNGSDRSGSPVPRHPPDGSLAASAAIPEPASDQAAAQPRSDPS